LNQKLAEALFRFARIRQIHIIGCSRSGTTMLHAAMSAFERTALNPAESPPDIVGIRRTIRIIRRLRAQGLKRSDEKFFITKREAGWLRPDRLDHMVREALAHDVGVIHIVRDPRDVLLSQHGDGKLERYVTPEHWRLSIEAAEQAERALERRVPWLTLRYEDVVTKPREAEAALTQRFGLTLRRGARLDRVADNLELSGLKLHGYMDLALRGLRNADPTSIGKWKRAPENPEVQLLADPAAAPVYRAFMKRHGYG